MKSCTNCGSTEIDEDPARGDATCTACGTVLEESIVVTENQFQERAGGSGHTLVGQFVSAERAASNNFNGMGTQESREVTFAKGRKVIEEVASQLRINQHCIDTAFNFFKMCVSRNLTRGRTRAAVVAVCLYITCRLENTAHLLLDFSDITQINVFDLGRNFNFISRSLRITLPATDPCMYIIRFACMLDLGDKQKDVVNLATRLVQRMKRDWMSTGRRPTGICGAALLMAARSLNFNRSINDIVRVVHISETVIRKRLDEFSQTPSGSLTIDEFSTVDLEHYEDPPAFREARRKAREEQVRKEDEMTSQMVNGFGEIQTVLEDALDKKRKEKFKTSPFAKLVAGSIDGVEKKADDMIRDEVMNTVYDAAADQPSCSTDDRLKFEQFGPSLESLGIRKTESLFPQASSSSSSSSAHMAASNEIVDEDFSDSEIDGYILTEKEVEIKTEYWMKTNGEIMKVIEERKREREENGDVKRKRRPSKKAASNGSLTTYGAIEKVIHEKKLSNKINYDVLKDLDSFPGAKFKSPEAVSSLPNVVESITTNILNPLPADFQSSDLTRSERTTKRVNMRRGKGTKNTLDELCDVFDIRKEPEPVAQIVSPEKKPTLSKYHKSRPILKLPPVSEERKLVVSSPEKQPEAAVEPAAIVTTEKADVVIGENIDEATSKDSADDVAKSPPEEVKVAVPKKSRYQKAKPMLAGVKKAEKKPQIQSDAEPSVSEVSSEVFPEDDTELSLTAPEAKRSKT